MITSNVIASALRKRKSVGVLGRVIARHNPCKYSTPLLTISTLSFALYDLLLDFGLSFGLAFLRLRLDIQHVRFHFLKLQGIQGQRATWMAIASLSLIFSCPMNSLNRFGSNCALSDSCALETIRSFSLFAITEPARAPCRVISWFSSLRGKWPKAPVDPPHY